MDDVRPSTPLRHMLWLAWILSAIYLAAGGAIALLNRASHGASEGVRRLALAMDMFAAAFLRLVHLWEPLLMAMGNGRMETWEVRVILMSLSVALIFLYAFTVGLLLNLLRALWSRLG